MREQLIAMEDIPPEGTVTADLLGREVLVMMQNGHPRAYLNVCMHHGGPLTLEGDTFTCSWHGSTFEARTGKVRWSLPGVADWHAGLIGTGDGKVLLYDGKGTLRLLAGDAGVYRELARAEIGLTASINPVLAGGRIYLRDRKEILCLQIGDTNASPRR